MLKEWFVNFTILISFVSIYNHIHLLIENKIKKQLEKKIIEGIMGGILCSFLLVFSIKVSTNIYLDLRYLSIIYIINYIGSIAACISCSITILSIFFLYGFNSISVFNSIGLALITVFGVLIIRNNKRRKDNLAILIIQGLIIATILFKIVDPSNFQNNIIIIIEYWILTLLVAVIAYALMEYLVASNNAIRILKEEASRDYLTGLYNVRTFNRIYITLVEEYKNTNRSISYMILDIDYFKSINDNYGHNSGDEVLIKFCEILKSVSKGKYILSRMGGEEFSIILPDYNKDECIQVAEEIRSEVEKYRFYLPTGDNIKVTVSIGIASYPEDDKCIGKLIARADSALYKAKRNGRNMVCELS